MRITLWTLMHDPETLKNHSLDPLDFAPGATRYLVTKVAEVWGTSRSLLTPPIMQQVLEQDGDLVVWGTTVEEVVDLYADLYDRFDETEADSKAKRLVATKLLRALRINRRLDEAAESMETGDYEGAERALEKAQLSFQPNRSEVVLDIDGPVHQVERQRVAIPTGIEQFDKWFKGGIHLGQMGVVLAPPNVGKSMFLPLFAASAMRDSKNVIYYSTELPEDEVYKRVLSALTQTSIGQMRPEDAVEQLRSQRKDTDKTMGRVTIRFRDTGTLTTVDIATDIAEMKEQGIIPHLVILDGDDIGIAGKERNEQLYGMYFYIYGQLAGLVAHENVAVWTAAQATRKALDTGYVAEGHVADSMWKLRRADLMFGIGAGQKFRTEEGDPFMRLYVLKDRYYGKKGRYATLVPKWGYKGAPGTVGFSDQFDMDRENGDPFEEAARE